MKNTLRMKSVLAIVMLVVALAALGVTLGLVFAPASPVMAQEDSNVVIDDTADQTDTAAEEEDSKGMTAMAAGIAVGVAAAAGAIAMGIAVAKTNESIARQPEAKAEIRSSMMLGLVFIETAIIYALIVAILLIFVM